MLSGLIQTSVSVGGRFAAEKVISTVGSLPQTLSDIGTNISKELHESESYLSYEALEKKLEELMQAFREETGQEPPV